VLLLTQAKLQSVIRLKQIILSVTQDKQQRALQDSAVVRVVRRFFSETEFRFSLFDIPFPQTLQQTPLLRSCLETISEN